MELIFHALITVISLIFLGILGAISGVAVPGLFIPAIAPWLDWALPTREHRDERR